LNYFFSEEEKRLQEFSLKPLYKKPPPVWVHPTFLGEFGDAYLEGIAAGADLNTTLAAFSLVLDRTVKEQKFLLSRFQHQDAQALDYLVEVFREAKDLSRKVLTVLHLHL
jgi:hypothetical protein